MWRIIIIFIAAFIFLGTSTVLLVDFYGVTIMIGRAWPAIEGSLPVIGLGLGAGGTVLLIGAVYMLRSVGFSMDPLLYYIKRSKMEDQKGKTEDEKGIVSKGIVSDAVKIIIIKESEFFDSDWYIKKYPDVTSRNMEAANHYYYYGAYEQNNPGPDFDTSFYLKKYPDVAALGINPLFHYIAWGKNESRAITPPPPPVTPSRYLADDLQEKLWGGYSRYAIRDLEELKNKTGITRTEFRRAAWYLMSWYFATGEYSKSFYNAYLCRKTGTPSHTHYIAEAYCLFKLEQLEDSINVIDLGLSSTEKHKDYYLLKSLIVPKLLANSSANIDEYEKEKLFWINKIFKNENLSVIKKKYESKPLCFTNITSSVLSDANQIEKVSIIIPAYNAENIIGVALESLQNQTWKNIEIIVVDDCSHDDTADIVENYSKYDSRIKCIRKSHNEGAYMARNTGLKYITGDYIVTHDSDDWSHPQKIELQVEELKSRPDCVAVMSHWVRMDKDLNIIGPWKHRGGFSDLNFSSLMVKRKVIDELGPWSNVRISGDAEYRFRIWKYYGVESVVILDRDKVLSLSLVREDSLTRSENTNVSTLDFGLRWQYRDSFLYWQSRDNFQTDPYQNVLETPIPVGIRSNSNDFKYDVVLISDFTEEGNNSFSGIELLRRAISKYNKVGAYHWRKYGPDIKMPLAPDFYELCKTGSIDILTFSNIIRVKTVIIANQDLIRYIPDITATFQVDNLYIIYNQDTIADADINSGSNSLSNMINTKGLLVSSLEMGKYL